MEEEGGKVEEEGKGEDAEEKGEDEVMVAEKGEEVVVEVLILGLAGGREGLAGSESLFLVRTKEINSSNIFCSPSLLLQNARESALLLFVVAFSLCTFFVSSSS